MGNKPYGHVPVWEDAYVGKGHHGIRKLWEMGAMGNNIHGKEPPWENVSTRKTRA